MSRFVCCFSNLLRASPSLTPRFRSIEKTTDATPRRYAAANVSFPHGRFPLSIYICISFATFYLINNAYTILSNDELRKTYDSLRELEENEEKNFVSLKTQYKKEVLEKKADPDAIKKKELAAESFQEKMDRMNREKEQFATTGVSKYNNEDIIVQHRDISGSINKNLSNFQSSREKDNKDIVDHWKATSKEEIDEFLRSQKINPADNFKSEFSNINFKRNEKIEATNKEYDGLVNDMGGKYATLDEAFGM